MCIILVKKSGALMPIEYLKESMINNPDGFGFAFYFVNSEGKNELFVYKNYIKDINKQWEDFVREYERVGGKDGERLKDYIVVYHFRIATTGTKKKENCHPFVKDYGVFFHNGCLSEYERKVDENGKLLDMTDTEMWLDTWLDKERMKDEKYLHLLYKTISWSKIVRLFENENGVIETQIVKEKTGHWLNDNTIWVSNTSYKKEEISNYDSIFYKDLYDYYDNLNKELKLNKKKKEKKKNKKNKKREKKKRKYNNK